MQGKTPQPTGDTPRPRGRPRSHIARRAILRAAREILERDGPSAVSVEAVAARAGVGKPTIYRSWSNAQALMMAALMDGSAPLAPAHVVPANGAKSAPPATSVGVAALRQQLRDIAATFASRTGRNVAMMLASAEPDTELSKSFRHHFILARREEGRRFLQQATSAGELRPGIDVETALDLIYAPIFYRLLVGHGDLDAAWADAVVDHVLAGLGAGGAAKPARSGKRRRAR